MLTLPDPPPPTPPLKCSEQNGQQKPQNILLLKSKKKIFLHFFCVFLRHLSHTLYGVSKRQVIYLFYSICTRTLSTSTLSYAKPLSCPTSVIVGAIIFSFYWVAIGSLNTLSYLTKGTQLVNGKSGVQIPGPFDAKAHLLGICPWTIYLTFIGLSFLTCRMGIIAPIKQ